jgi:hypothetical protein
MAPNSPILPARDRGKLSPQMGPVEFIQVTAPTSANHKMKPIQHSTRRGVGRIAGFFCLIVVLLYIVNGMINSGLRRIKTSQFGVSNKIVQGKINADIIITGSSRAISHYDPRIIEAITGRTAFNLGRNGSQTDMQLAVLKTYLAHNRTPKLVLHNLDAFSFVTTREVYDPAQYMPYLGEDDIYAALHHISPEIWWKAKYLPVYGLKGCFGWSPREDFFLGFNPRVGHWTADFENFKTTHGAGTTFDIEPEGVRIMEDLIRVCHDKGIKLVFVYSPEYREMQMLTKNRAEIFAKFSELSERYNVPLWDFSDWNNANNHELFRNSQHLNAEGAKVFSQDLANRLAKELPRLIPAST